MRGKSKKQDQQKLREQSRRLRDSIIWFLKGFTLYYPQKKYPGFYLSPQQSYVLTIVNEYGPISPGDVARKLGLEKSHLTKIMNSLISMGALNKKKEIKDQRRFALELTSKGRQIFRELDKVSVESWAGLMKHIPAEEREKVIHAAGVMHRALEALREERKNEK